LGKKAKRHFSREMMKGKIDVEASQLPAKIFLGKLAAIPVISGGKTVHGLAKRKNGQTGAQYNSYDKFF
jgi:hypothetical protein